ncbi:hypothetical protein CF326_g2877 [Tilletia indica]|uniref:Uncharacterized protein n=1 Tax=Tilletia indica TaxID=43049 RepID=A0A177T7N1_9BASI|nr:hypothetical protein CF326_g2877 [Tilletia indica]KAE8246357.1 hypothetical protein A4X13_0g5826 [Tilletia indica]
MTETQTALEFYRTELGLAAARYQDSVHGMAFPAVDLLPRVLDATDPMIDRDIALYSKQFPRTTARDWQFHLLSLSADVEPYLNTNGHPSYFFDRCGKNELRGVKMFDHLRKGYAYMRSEEAWKTSFRAFGGTMLDGMDFGNVFIAGGSVLACLSESDFEKTLRSSDIDLFLYGLDEEQTLQKLENIENTLRRNTPDYASRYQVERGVGAITFVPRVDEEGRRIQVVLKSYRNPAEILASFDFDQVCMGYDGTSVWLSLRALRALGTGYTFTTGAISSSFAARIVKYGTRGYGLLVRPGDDTAEDDEDGDSLLQNLERLQEKKCREISHRFRVLPWSGVGNYRRVFDKMKRTASNNWTHSFSSLATLAGLWELAYKTGRIFELMEEVGACSHFYGLYEGSETVVGYFDCQEWLETLSKMSPSLAKRRWPFREKVWKFTTMDNVVSAARRRLVQIVIIPIGLREHLNMEAPGVGNADTLTRMRSTTDLVDVDGDQMEICLWSVTSENMCQPLEGVASSAHQLLTKAAMLTAWTVWKVSSGAPWEKMCYGRSLFNAVLFSHSAAVTEPGDFGYWLRG